MPIPFIGALIFQVAFMFFFDTTACPSDSRRSAARNRSVDSKKVLKWLSYLRYSAFIGRHGLTSQARPLS